MSKSVERVITTLRDFGVEAEAIELGDCRTAADAARAIGCEPDQIAKSIVFARGDGCALFLTAGSSQVNATRASALAGAPLVRADAAMVRNVTGFAIGGVAPVGHLNRGPVWMDERLMDFDRVWASAGTPRHVFAIAPADLLRVTGATLAEFT